MDLLTLVPPELGWPSALLLVTVSFLTSALTAAVGIGGGLALIAVMASVMPALAVVPIHGVVQLGSNLGRAVVQRHNVVWDIVLWFGLGSLAGAFLGGRIVFALPVDVLKALLGAFVLYTVWGPKPRLPIRQAPAFLVGGGVTSFLTMFVGATGAFAAAILPRERMDRQQVVGTHAANMTIQHLLKIVVFGLLGFAFAPWMPLMVAMIVTGILGTLAGTRLLNRLPEQRFALFFKLALTALAINLLIGALI